MRESGAETRDRSSVPPSIWVASLLLSNLMVVWSANCRARCLPSLLVGFEPRKAVGEGHGSVALFICARGGHRTDSAWASAWTNHSTRWSSSELVAFLRYDGRQDAGLQLNVDCRFHGVNVDRFSHSKLDYVFFFMKCGDVFLDVFSGDRCIVLGEVVALDSSVL